MHAPLGRGHARWGSSGDFVNFFFYFFKVHKPTNQLLINVESIERFKVTADIISILIHNNTLQSFV